MKEGASKAKVHKTLSKKIETLLNRELVLEGGGGDFGE